MDHEDKKTTNRPGEGALQPEGALQVFYDGACPLCQAEISMYRKAGAQAQFCDVAQDTAPRPEGRSKQQMLARFHVRRADGKLVSGAAAFAQLWKATPGWRWIGQILAVPPFVWIAEGMYRLFLPVRPALQALARRLEQR